MDFDPNPVQEMTVKIKKPPKSTKNITFQNQIQFHFDKLTGFDKISPSSLFPQNCTLLPQLILLGKKEKRIRLVYPWRPTIAMNKKRKLDKIGKSQTWEKGIERKVIFFKFKEPECISWISEFEFLCVVVFMWCIKQAFFSCP